MISVEYISKKGKEICHSIFIPNFIFWFTHSFTHIFLIYKDLIITIITHKVKFIYKQNV